MPLIEDTLTIDPRPASSIIGAAARMPLNVPLMETSTMRSYSRSL
jgi:hypothetical protein